MARSAVESGIALEAAQPAPHWETSIWPLVCSIGVLFVLPLAFSFYFVYQKPMIAVFCLGVGVPVTVWGVTGWVREAIAGHGEGLVVPAMAWFNSHPAVYGGIGGVLLLSGEVWVHHLYTAGMPDWLRLGQMVSTLLISVPVGLLMISLLGTLYRGSISFRTPMLYALAVNFTFLIGGLTGIPLAMATLDLNLSDTYFIPGHFHYVMAVSGTFAIFGAVYYLFPKMTGRMYSEVLGWIGFILTFAGINLVFFPMMIAGLYGMPRRYFDFEQFPEVAGLQYFMSLGSVVILAGAIVILWSWIQGLVKGEKASANPWGSRSLEWTTPSPPPPGNFGPKLPVITPEWHPYNYGRARPAPAGM